MASKKINYKRLAKRINEKSDCRHMIKLTNEQSEQLKPLLTVEFYEVSSNDDLYALRYKSNILAIISDKVWIKPMCKSVFNTITI